MSYMDFIKKIEQVMSKNLGRGGSLNPRTSKCLRHLLESIAIQVQSPKSFEVSSPIFKLSGSNKLLPC